MDDMKRLIEKYKQELMEYSRKSSAGASRDFPVMPEMIEDSEPQMPGFSYYPEVAQTTEEPAEEQAPAAPAPQEEMPAPQEMPEPQEEIPAPQESSDNAPREEPRKPQVIGYVDDGNGDIIAQYNELFAEMLPNTSLVPSFQETQEEITETSTPNGNVPETEPVSGVTDNAGLEPRPDTPASGSVSPETAERLTDQPISGTSPDEQLTGRNFEDGTPVRNNPADIKPLENEGQPFVGYTEPVYDSYEDFAAQNTSRGQMRFFIYTAREALPVVGAVCVISKILGGKQTVLHTLTTDISGQTPIVNLPAPSRELSQTAGSLVQPYSLFDAQVSAKGFTTVKLKNIPVFDGVLSLQRTAMVPEANGSEEIINESENNENGGV
ncbi:MAG: hypothetical protein ACI4Q4_02580 [Oscillospiraceae bacterium]